MTAQNRRSGRPKVFNLPNCITLSRLVLVCALLALLYVAEDEYKIWVFIVLAILNNVLDGVDGALARRLNQTTDTGKFLDAAGDRLCKSLLMCLLSYMGVFPWLLTAFHLGFKNQFFELPAFYVEGRIGDRNSIRSQLPFYYQLTYFKPWIVFGVILNHVIWGILIYNEFSRNILGEIQLYSLYALFFLHSLARALPVYSIYEHLGREAT